jgi:acyl dehydratase
LDRDKEMGEGYNGSGNAVNEIFGSLYFDDFFIGQKFVTKARTVTEEDVVNFAALSWDHNRLHTDAEYAASTKYGQRIAHGLLGMIIHSGLAYQLTEESILAFLELTWQFKLPIYIGDTIHVEQTVKEMREISKPNQGILTFEKEVFNQKGDVVQTGTTTILIAKRCYGQEV